MYAKSKPRRGKPVPPGSPPKKSIHKVLQCRNACNRKRYQGDGPGRKKRRAREDTFSADRCGRSFDRDTNASRNILRLLMLHIAGQPRWAPLCRPQRQPQQPQQQQRR
ncbi:MAG: hypothetical protein WDW38_008833 [Sanguina aurantia]